MKKRITPSSLAHSNKLMVICRYISAVVVFALMTTGCGGSSGASRSTSSMGVNVWLVAIPDYAGEGDPNLAAMLDRFKEDFLKAGIETSNIVVRELTGPTAEQLTYVDMNTGDMEAILKLSYHQCS